MVCTDDTWLSGLWNELGILDHYGPVEDLEYEFEQKSYEYV